MSWILLILAGLFEIGGVIFLKYSEGFTKLKHTLLFALFLGLSFIFLSLSLRDIPISIGYGIWTGIGASGSVLLGMYVFNEPKNARKLAMVFGIIVSIVGLKLVS
ncbi:DMT family transporter [Paenibacillus xylanexedens]|uniref:DMT family transporter n=1 Tax=Paenibacillus xylanexedens TaxID=528191 RepID=UPI0011A40DA3|nr:multidrug efflux SMR transporter [Paenibacillus xylanexedens]